MTRVSFVGVIAADKPDALQKDYFYSNQFLACLCTGQNPNGEYGNETMSQSASNCESCSTTPALIKKDLSVSAVFAVHRADVRAQPPLFQVDPGCALKARP